ncbi:DUF397 domain-containing protein [Amycolatopsis sp. NPDC059021]|uniref:DUF397 domain-containing protein n=1 Tax=Amycolatopsis sp. NPDC059021 TaxID=3346704 RepID=UPI00366E1ACE
MDLTNASWRKSSHSSGEGANGDCVEIAFVSGLVGVRDSKAPTAGTLAVSAKAWRHLVATCQG